MRALKLSLSVNRVKSEPASQILARAWNSYNPNPIRLWILFNFVFFYVTRTFDSGSESTRTQIWLGKMDLLQPSPRLSLSLFAALIYLNKSYKFYAWVCCAERFSERA
jgi:hypothetical protein